MRQQVSGTAASATARADASHICFVTPGHLASNPRLVKEARTTTAAGYRVSVVFSQNIGSLVSWDEEIVQQNPEWNAVRVRWTDRSLPERWLRLHSGLRQRAAYALFARCGVRATAVPALGRVHRELLKAACGTPADLYIAHNLAALPAAALAAERNGAKLGFDAEDFHRGELPDVLEHSAMGALVRQIEEEFLPRAHYITAASDGIADAYAEALGIARPRTILNVFPLAERSARVPAWALEAEREPGIRTLYWFSQTIGSGRGLEAAVGSLRHLPEDVHLVIRGSWASGYQSSFYQLVDDLEVRKRIHVREPVPPHWLVPLARRHHVGLALESVQPGNRNIAITNKLFTYFLAGLPCIATDTAGQRSICEMVPEGTRIVTPGNPEEIARAAEDLLRAGERARAAALQSAEERFCWDVEKDIFLEAVASVLPVGPPGPSVRTAS